MIFDSLENPADLFVDNSTLCDISHPSDRKAAASSLSADLDKNQLVQHLEYIFQP